MIDGESYTTEYAWDLADRLATITYPSDRVVTFTRDSQGQVTAVSTQAAGQGSPVNVATGIDWQAFGPMTSLTHGNSLVRTLGWDLDLRLTDLETSAGATVVQDLSYSHNPLDLITGITDNLNAARTQTFRYDDLYRLTDADGLYGAIDYAYDAVGNRLSRIIADGAATTVETYSYAVDSNRLEEVVSGAVTRTFTYDAMGNIISDDDGLIDNDLTYNHAGRYSDLSVNAVADTDYLYNALGQRVLKQDDGASATATHFHYDLTGRLIAESDADGDATREVIHLGGLTLAIAADPGSPTTLTWVHADHLGQPQKMTDDAQVVIWDHVTRPFGETELLTGAATNNQRFPGQYTDGESGYAYNYFRDYDPSLGRYLQSDPIGLNGGLNTYAYVGGNPVLKIDPRGLDDTFGILQGLFPAHTAFFSDDPIGGSVASQLDYANQINSFRSFESGVAMLVIAPQAQFSRVQSGVCRIAEEAVEQLGDLTSSETSEIQQVVDRAGRPLEVVGSAARGTRQNPGTNLPIGKGPGTRSDIDYTTANSNFDYFSGLEGELPSANPGTPILRGTTDTNIGPGIRFEPGQVPRFLQ